MQTEYQIAVSKMTDAERDIPLTDLLHSVGLVHFPHGGHSREIRQAATNELVGFYRCDEAIILYIKTRDVGLSTAHGKDRTSLTNAGRRALADNGGEE